MRWRWSGCCIVSHCSPTLTDGNRSGREVLTGVVRCGGAGGGGGGGGGGEEEIWRGNGGLSV